MSRNTNRIARALLVLSLLYAYGGCAEQEAQRDPAVEGMAHVEAPIIGLEDHFYPPDLVLDHQGALGLTETQRSSILEEVSGTQTRLVELDANLRRDIESLNAILDDTEVDESAAMSAAERVMRWENQIKSIQLRMLIRIKNQLTEAQQALLEEAR